jgi:hypothetical protein
MKKRSLYSAITLSLVFLAMVIFFLQDRPADPREAYEQYLLEQFAMIPIDVDEQAAGANRPDRPDLAAIQNYFNTLDPELGRVPSERLKSSWEYTRDLQQSSLRSSSLLNWTTAGSDMGGRTRAIMYDPNDPSGSKVWAGAVTGGLWYNNDITDADSPWQVVDDFFPNLSISCIISDPGDPQVFYAGTGEAETARVIYRESSGVGMGIMKTMDGGESWDFLASTESFKYVTDIQIRDEGGNSVIYAGVASGIYKGVTHQSDPSNGLFRSDDGGASWEQVLPNIPGYSEPYAVSDIKIQSDGRIYVGSMGTPELQGGATLFYSDQGTAGSWNVYSNVKNLIQNQSTYNIPGRVILAIAPSADSIVYALFSVGYIRDQDGFVGYKGRYIFRTTNKGESWEAINVPDNDYATLAWHALTAAVDPYNPDHLYVGGLDVWSSLNAGVSWNHLTNWAGMYYGGGDDYVHADQHVQLYKEGSGEEMLFGSDGGVFYTDNASSASPIFQERNKNYSTLQFYTCAISPIPGDDRFIGGLQDNGTLYFQGNPLDINDMIDGGDGAYCFWDKNEPNIFITSYYYNRYTIFINGSPYQSAGQQSGTFICPADYDSDLNILYANACTFKGLKADQILRITNIPNNPNEGFDYLGTGESTAFTFMKLSPHSPENTSTLYVGGQTGRLFRVENAESNPQTTEITGNNFPVGSISSIAIGGSEDTLMVTFSNYGVPSVWVTFDGGYTWRDVEGNLPDMPVRYAIFHPSDSKQAMLATELGIWTCNHLQFTLLEWAPNAEGMANVRIDMLQIRELDNTVLAATHGRGMYSTTWPSDPWVSVEELPALDVTAIWPNPVENELNIEFGSVYAKQIDLSVTDMQGRMVLQEKINPESKTYKVSMSHLSAGTYIIRMNNGEGSFTRKILHR